MKFRQGHNFSLSKVFAKLEFNELQNYPSSRFRRNWQSRDRKSLENQHPYWLRCSRPNSKKVEKVSFFSQSSKEETFDKISQNPYSSSGLHPNIILPPPPVTYFLERQKHVINHSHRQHLPRKNFEKWKSMNRPLGMI